jgi:hypothetical protein
MSSEASITEKNINDTIAKVESDSQVEWLLSLIKATDYSKYMLVAEKGDGSGSSSPAIGVKVIDASQDRRATEKLINETLKEMELDEDKNFVSICHPAEFLYIILYENKAGTFPRVKIIPNPSEPRTGNFFVTGLLQRLDDDEEWGLQPYDSFMLDRESMIILFEEE